MPIYEFLCLSCGNIEEFILVGSGQIEMKCRACGGEDLERVLSRTNYAMGSSGSSQSSGASATTRSCGHGQSCTSIELPGHTKQA
ncbi:MAG: zinc ribbon domain-containing protein [Syntrophobacteraceae bacterium]